MLLTTFLLGTLAAAGVVLIRQWQGDGLRDGLRPALHAPSAHAFHLPDGEARPALTTPAAEGVFGMAPERMRRFRPGRYASVPRPLHWPT